VWWQFKVEVQVPCKLSRYGLFARAAALIALSVCIAKGDTVVASLYSPYAPTGSTVIAINLTGISTPSQAEVGGGTSGLPYAITFGGVGSEEGVVQNSLSGKYAVPVAGAVGGGTSTTPEYLTAGYGSSLTSNIAASGNYLSTGTGTITMTFTSTQHWLVLLWGSIDTANSVTVNDGGGTSGANFTETGTALQQIVDGFTTNGSQGVGGSAYVVINSPNGFTTVTLTSGVVSFEFAGVATSTKGFQFAPEPSSTLLIGSGFGMGIWFAAIRRRRIAKAANSGASQRQSINRA
jgi:hypothetical protein